MRFSIITACYNRASTIGEAITSVAGQTHRDIEHIVVDGGSTDGTLGVVERHRDSVAKLISGPDKGAYDAFNKGVAASRCEVVGFLHSDDFYADCGVLQREAEEMAAHAFHALYDVQHASQVDWQQHPARGN